MYVRASRLYMRSSDDSLCELRFLPRFGECNCVVVGELDDCKHGINHGSGNTVEVRKLEYDCPLIPEQQQQGKPA